MTNSEYFEKNNVPFAEVMEIFNKQKKFKSFDEFLVSEYVEFKYKVGDIVVLDCSKELPRCEGWDHNVVFQVSAIVNASSHPYNLIALTPAEIKCSAVHKIFATKIFVEDNCVPY